MPTPLSATSVQEAAARLGDGIVRTPCTPSFHLANRCPGAHYFKAEFRQRTGSFKDRGALNRLLLLSEEQRAAGVIAASAGNHAQALAFHASRLGIPVTIVMPESAPLIKVANTRGFGARVFQVGQTINDGMAEVERLIGEEGLSLVHAFGDPAVAAGQGTMGVEILEQVPDVTTLLVPIGGGGMISGIAVAVKDARPGIKIIGVEAKASPTAFQSLRAGHPLHIPAEETLADGIAVKQIGETTFPVIRDLVDDVVLVDENDIATAIFFLLEQEKVVVEGGGAVGVAALLSDKVNLRAGDKTVTVLSGGNIDVNMISRIIDRGLWLDGRKARLQVTVRDRPGHLNALTRTVASLGGNVLDIHHTRAFGDISVGDVQIAILVETRGRDHVAELVHELKELGHEVEEGP